MIIIYLQKLIFLSLCLGYQYSSINQTDFKYNLNISKSLQIPNILMIQTYKGKNIQQANLQQYRKCKKFLATVPIEQLNAIPKIQLQNQEQNDSIVDFVVEKIKQNQTNSNNQRQAMLNKYLGTNQNSKISQPPKNKIQIDNKKVFVQRSYQERIKPANNTTILDKIKNKCKEFNNRQPKIQQINNAKEQQQLCIQQIPISISSPIKLKIQKPLTRNYRIANQEEWERKSVVSDDKLEQILKKHFKNVKSFRNNQRAIIKCSLSGEDVFVCMPTGGGKSLTFQVQTYVKKGVYLCVLPLVSLIHDQQQQARKMNIKAYSLTAATTKPEIKAIYSQLKQYNEQQQSIVLFCTPQKVNLSQTFIQLMKQVYERGFLRKIVIDEVHCVSTWGKQFRKQYENLWSLRLAFPRTSILALTATVTEAIKQDVINKLKMKNCLFFQSSFNRPNLFYQVLPKTKTVLQEITKILKKNSDQSGIIYCLSKKDCEQMCKILKNLQFKVAYYHAGMPDGDRKDIQQKWMNGTINIIIATIAFGMGINKPNVRYVIHHSLSKSLENYYQESGRAGRDGLPARCTIFYRPSDRITLQSLTLKNQYSTMQSKDFCSKQLTQIIRYCQDRFICRRQFQLAYLGEEFNPKDCNKSCDNCYNQKNFIQYECISQAKMIVQALLTLNTSFNFTLKQLVTFCRKSKLSNAKISSYINRLIEENNLNELTNLFKGWSESQIQSLLLELINQDILVQRVYSINNCRKGKKQQNFQNTLYLKANIPKAKHFLQNQSKMLIRRENITKQTNKPKIKSQNNSQFNTQEQDKTLEFFEDLDVQFSQDENQLQKKQSFDEPDELLQQFEFEKVKYQIKQQQQSSKFKPNTEETGLSENLMKILDQFCDQFQLEDDN